MTSNAGDLDPESTIVVGVDGSDHSRFALKWAADEAKRHRYLLRVLYGRISEPKHLPGWYEDGSSDLSPEQAVIDDAYGLVATRHPSVRARTEIVEGPPAMGLTSASRSAKLLVVGARGMGGFEELLLGSVSDQCIHYAHSPVVIVRGDPDALPLRAAESRIVVGIDGSPGSEIALKWAIDEARARSASIEAIHAWQYPPVGAFVVGPRHGYAQTAHEITEAAANWAATWGPDLPIQVNERFGAEVPTLIDASEGADLLVVGSRGHGGFRQVLLGSVSHQCARHAKCTVVVARPVQGEGADDGKGGSSAGAQTQSGPGRRSEDEDDELPSRSR